MRHSSCDTEIYLASTSSLVHSRSEPTGTTTATKSFLLLPHRTIAARYASRTSLAYSGRSLPTVNVCPLLVQIWENLRRGLTQAGSASACGSFMIQVLIVMERSGLFDLICIVLYVFGALSPSLHFCVCLDTRVRRIMERFLNPLHMLKANHSLQKRRAQV